MTEQQQSIWRILRIVGPIFMFFIVMFVCLYILNIELVLSVVFACLFSIIEYVTLTWLMRRTGGST